MINETSKIIYSNNDFDWRYDDEYIEQMFYNFVEEEIEWDNDWRDENGDI